MRRANSRSKYVEAIFIKHDANQNGFLDDLEAKEFLKDVFDYDYTNQFHRQTASKILDIIGEEKNSHAYGQKQYSLQRFQQFFSLPDFIEHANIAKLNSLDALNAAQERAAAEGHEVWPIDHQEKYSFTEGWFQVVLILVNVAITCFFIMNDQFTEKKGIRTGFWRMLSIPFTAVYFVEMLMVLFTNDGATILREKKLYLVELVCQGTSIMAYVLMFNPDGSQESYANGASLLSFAFLIRNLRISILLGERREFRVIMDMCSKMTMPLMTQLACLYIIFYVFAIFGIAGLEGAIRMPRFHSGGGIPNNLYYLVNFNDLGSSMVTLYAFMIINNWPAMTDMMVNNTSGGDQAWPRIYFMLFYIIVQWIILNIVIAMMLEIFCSVEGEMDLTFDRLENIKKLKKMQKKMGAGFEGYCNDVNLHLMRETVDKAEMIRRSVKSKHDQVRIMTLFLTPCVHF